MIINHLVRILLLGMNKTPIVGTGNNILLVILSTIRTTVIYLDVLTLIRFLPRLFVYNHDVSQGNSFKRIYYESLDLFRLIYSKNERFKITFLIA
jgi:hypothetical protein